MRSLGIDFGSKRIGIAVSDATGVLASPLLVVQRSGSVESDHKRILAIAAEEEAEVVVIGLPITLQGQRSIAAEAILDEVEKLRHVTELPIELWDERMTTAAAHKNLRAQNVNAKKRRDQVDKFAAAVMLQGWLDSRRGDNSEAGASAW